RGLGDVDDGELSLEVARGVDDPSLAHLTRLELVATGRGPALDLGLGGDVRGVGERAVALLEPEMSAVELDPPGGGVLDPDLGPDVARGVELVEGLDPAHLEDGGGDAEHLDRVAHRGFDVARLATFALGIDGGGRGRVVARRHAPPEHAG